MNDLGFVPPMPPPMIRGERMRRIKSYITEIDNVNNISITEILRLSGAFIQNPPYNEIGFRQRPFRECFPTEDSFIGFVRYDDITEEAVNALRQKYREFVNNLPQEGPQQGGKRKRRRNKTRRRSNRRKSIRKNKTNRRRR